MWWSGGASKVNPPFPSSSSSVCCGSLLALVLADSGVLFLSGVASCLRQFISMVSQIISHSTPNSTIVMANSTKQNKKPTAVVDTPLYECVPVNWLWLPAPLRKILGHIVVTTFSLTFLSVPISLIFVTPYMLRNYPIICGVYLSSLVMSMLLPLKEWEYARVICQLTYELYGVSCNLSPKEIDERIQLGKKGQYIIGMRKCNYLI